MSSRLTQIAAIVVLVAAAGVVMSRLRSAPQDAEGSVGISQEAQARLKQRQMDRKLIRQGQRHRHNSQASDDAHALRLYLALIDEFPDLKCDAPMPNEENAIYQLNELALQMRRGGHNLSKDLHRFMGPGREEWDPNQARTLLKRYQWALDKLDKIAAMKTGSHTYFHGKANRDWDGPSALMPLLDLLRLRTRVWAHAANGTDSIPFGSQAFIHASDQANIWHLIRESEGSSLMHHLLVESAQRSDLGDPRDGRFYYRHSSMISDVGLNPHTHNQLLFRPYLGGDLNSQMLILEARRTWINELHTDVDPFLAKTKLISLDASRAYAEHVNQIITRLQQEDLQTFLAKGFPGVDAPSLSLKDQEQAQIRATSFNDSLRRTVYMAMRQHQAMVGIKIHERIAKLELIHGDLPYLDPITKTPYHFDFENFVLSRTQQIEGMGVRPLQIRNPLILSTRDTAITEE